METIPKELHDASFDALHEIVVDYIMEEYGECDHDKHGEILYAIIKELNKGI